MLIAEFRFRRVIVCFALMAMTGCAGGPLPFLQGAPPDLPPEPAPMLNPAMAAPPPPRGARTAAALDTTTPAQKAAALAAPELGGEQELGKVSVSLGAVAEPGFWLRTSLVTETVPGRVVTTAGQSVQVDLRPGTGAAQLSLAAYRALGLGLTDLPQVTVFGP